jgi:hypothetical protein
MSENNVQEPVRGVRMWLEQGSSVHLKAIEPSGDPVELAGHEIERVIVALQLLLAQLRAKSG